MFRCDCYPNHEICKNKNTCEFWIPLNEELDKVYRQISQELLQLQKLYQRKHDYFKIQSEIKQGMYTETINDNIVPNSQRVDYSKIKNDVRDRLGKFFYKETESKPMIITVIQEV